MLLNRKEMRERMMRKRYITIVFVGSFFLLLLLGMVSVGSSGEEMPENSFAPLRWGGMDRSSRMKRNSYFFERGDDMPRRHMQRPDPERQKVSGMHKHMRQNYYALTGVSPEATQDEIQRKYDAFTENVLASTADPGNPDWQRVHKELEEAYAVLRDPEERAQYDLLLEKMRMMHMHSLPHSGE
jgi:hypothetical protein